MKPKLSELSCELNVLTWTEIKSMAVQLDVEYDELRKIEENTREFDDQLNRAMNLWLKTDENASWKKIVKALKAINKIVLAKDIKKKYCTASNVTPTESTASSELLN